MNIFKIHADNAIELEDTSFFDENILESTLQDYIYNNPSCLSDETKYMLLSKEFSPWSKSKREIDIIGIDNIGNLVVVEVKRDLIASHADLQALRYAAMLQDYKFSDLITHYATTKNISQESAKQIIFDFIIEQDKERIEHTFDDEKEIVVILVSHNFSPEILLTAKWLRNKYNMDIRCISFKPYRDTSGIYIKVEPVIPVSEIEVDLWSKQQDHVLQKNVTKDRTKFMLNGEGPFSKGRFVHQLVKNYISENNPTYDQLKTTFFDEIQGTLGVFQHAEFATKNYTEKKYKRYYIDKDDILITSDRVAIAVCNQWGFGKDGKNMKDIINKAKALGYNVTTS